jgi:ankyrin repeat protein
MSTLDLWTDVMVALTANDLASLARLFEQHPGLRRGINDAVPGGAFGATPLLAALEHRNIGSIDILLRAGADINQRSHWWAGGFGVLDHDSGLEPLLIERGATVDVHAASRLGMSERLERLLQADPALVHSRGGDGQTPLHVAPSVDIATMLVQHGADIDAIDVDHESTPAQYHVRSHTDVARYLIALGCRTDILMAAAVGDLALVRRHLHNDPESIQTSVSAEFFPMRDPRAGGSIYIWTLGGNKTPHGIAREFGHEDVYQELMRSSPEALQFAEACESGDEATVRTISARNPDLARSLPERERRRLVVAAEQNNAEGVRRLLAAGWPVDARGNHGASALHFAAWLGNLTMVREVLRYQPPLELEDGDFGLSPLGWAIHGSEHSWNRTKGSYPETVEALLLAGAKAPASSGSLSGSPGVQRALRRHAS